MYAAKTIDQQLKIDLNKIKNFKYECGTMDNVEAETLAKQTFNMSGDNRTYEQCFNHAMIGVVSENVLPAINPTRYERQKYSISPTNWSGPDVLITDIKQRIQVKALKVDNDLSWTSITEGTDQIMWHIGDNKKYHSILRTANNVSSPEKFCDYTLFMLYKEIEKNKIYLISSGYLILNRDLIKRYIKETEDRKSHYLLSAKADYTGDGVNFNAYENNYKSRFCPNGRPHLIKQWEPEPSLESHFV